MPAVPKAPRKRLKPKPIFKSFIYSLIIIILLVIGYFAYQWCKPKKALPKFKIPAKDIQDPYIIKPLSFKLPELKLKKREQDSEDTGIVPDGKEELKPDLEADDHNGGSGKSDFDDLVLSTDVFEAIRNADLARFGKYFTAQDFDCESVEEATGFNVLHLAAYTKSYDMLEIIIASKKIDVNSEVKMEKSDYFELTSLYTLALSKFGLSNGKKEGDAAAEKLIPDEILEHVKSLVSRGAYYKYIASFLVKYTLGKNEEDNVKDESCSVEYSENVLKCAKLLISGGADIKFKTSDDYTPLMAAVDGNELELVRYYLSLYNNTNDRTKKRKISAMDFAMFPCHKETINLLIENGADYNSVNSFNRAAIHEAAARGCWVGAARLISIGVQIDSLTPVKDLEKEAKGFYHENALFGANSLLIAVNYKQDAMVEVLALIGADPFIRDSRNRHAESASDYSTSTRLKDAIRERVSVAIKVNREAYEEECRKNNNEK